VALTWSGVSVAWWTSNTANALLGRLKVNASATCKGLVIVVGRGDRLWASKLFHQELHKVGGEAPVFVWVSDSVLHTAGEIKCIVT
jgi:hypothetical protein